MLTSSKTILRSKLSLAAIACTLILTVSPLVSLTKQVHAQEAMDRAKVEEIIRSYLLANPELMLEVQQALEAKQKEERDAAVKVALSENKKTIFESPNQGVIGPEDAPITIVEFFDYNCGFCRRAMDDMNFLLATEKDVKFVMKELPILGPESVEASRISTAVYREYPKQYGEFHNRLLGLDGVKNGERAIEVAKAMNMDTAKLQEIGARGDVLDAFREANTLATSLGINGTPSYVVGEEVLFGALGQQVLTSKIENMRACGKSEC
ncbi:MAG: DsbA family protein [Pseudomonadota bacterium]